MRRIHPCCRELSPGASHVFRCRSSFRHSQTKTDRDPTGVVFTAGESEPGQRMRHWLANSRHARAIRMRATVGSSVKTVKLTWVKKTSTVEQHKMLNLHPSRRTRMDVQ